MAETRDIKYINKTFSDFRGQLIEYAKNYFPDTYNDFSATSPGMMFIEMASYVGDVLSFYQDTQLQETFLQHAKNPGNLYSLAYMMGYRPRVTSPSEVTLDVTQLVNATGPGNDPDFNQAVVIDENSVVKASTSNSTKFLLKEKVDFRFSSSLDPTEITINSITNGIPVNYQLKKSVKAVAGEIKTASFTFTAAQKFTTLTIDDSNIIGVLDIVDSDSNTWYEVPFLGQETVYVEESNNGADSDKVPTKLRLQKVPRRFVTRFNSTGQLNIQFGAGIAQQDDEVFTPNPKNVGARYSGGLSRLDYAYDPSNFLFTETYGLAPSNTTLTVRYLVGGGVSSNEPSNTIIVKENLSVTATDPTNIGSIAFNNPEPASGGRDADTLEEIRQNSLRAFNEQARVITLGDYQVRSLSLPSRFGSLGKVYVTKTNLSDLEISSALYNSSTVSIYVLALNQQGKLTTASPTLKENLRTYLSEFMPVSDTVDIKDAFVINFGIEFEVISLPNTISRDVLLRCTQKLTEYFDISKWNINQPINLNPVYTLLDQVKGVQTVQSIRIVNKSGGNYTPYGYDIDSALRNNIVYPSLDPSIFELKFPNTDIIGRVISL